MARYELFSGFSPESVILNYLAAVDTASSAGSVDRFARRASMRPDQLRLLREPATGDPDYGRAPTIDPTTRD